MAQIHSSERTNTKIDKPGGSPKDAQGVFINNTTVLKVPQWQSRQRRRRQDVVDNFSDDVSQALVAAIVR